MVGKGFKKWGLFLLILTIAFSLVLGGCGSKPAAPAPAAPSAPAPAPEKKVLNLKYSTWDTEVGMYGKAAAAAAKEIEEKTQGRIKITCYYSGSLVPMFDAYKGITSGLSDITRYNVDVTPNAHVLNRIFNLPFTGPAPDPIKLTALDRQLLKEFPELQAECQKGGALWLDFYAMVGFDMATTKKVVKSPADLKGMKISLGGTPAEQVAAIQSKGCAVVPTTAGDWYNSLDKGIIDGTLFNVVPMKDVGVWPLMKKVTLMGDSGWASGVSGFMINNKVWTALSPEDQKIVKAAYTKACDDLIKASVELKNAQMAAAPGEGKAVIKLTTAEMQPWYDMNKPFIEKWIKDTEAAGFPAKKIYDRMLQLGKEATAK